MKAISTRYLGPTDFRGARIVADDGDGNRVVIGYDHAARNPHFLAAEALAQKLGWVGAVVEGSTKTGRVYCWLAGDTFAIAAVSRD